jgi:hypothetical protein
MNVEINADDMITADKNSVQPELKCNIATKVETQLLSAQLLQDTEVVGSLLIDVSQ